MSEVFVEAFTDELEKLSAYKHQSASKSIKRMRARGEFSPELHRKFQLPGGYKGTRKDVSDSIRSARQRGTGWADYAGTR